MHFINQIFLMILLDKTKSNVSICGIELSFIGNLSASSIAGWQSFFNSLMVDTNFTKAYVGLGSVSFSEESEVINAGPLYKQKVTIALPNGDSNRSERIALLQQTKLIKIKLSDGTDLVIGRNDFKQNARPKIKIACNVKKAMVEFETVSIFPSGFVSNQEGYLLPAFIPITLI